MQHLGTSLNPIVHEGRLHVGNRRSLQTKMGITPVLRRLGVAKPLIRNPHTAGEANLAVNHQQLSVRPMVHPGQAVPA